MDGLAAETSCIGVNKPGSRDLPCFEDVAGPFARKRMRSVGGESAAIWCGMGRTFTGPPCFERGPSTQREAGFELLEVNREVFEIPSCRTRGSRRTVRTSRSSR